MRHRLNDKLAQTGGHIGYAVRSSERKKDYGNKLLALLLVEYEKIGLNKVQIGANIASNKIILNHGGVLIRSSNSKNFYHIDIAYADLSNEG